MTKALTNIDQIHGVGCFVQLPVGSTYISVGIHIYNPNYPANHGYTFRVFTQDLGTKLADRYTAQSSNRGQNYDIRFRLRRIDNTDWIAGVYYVVVDPSDAGEGAILITHFQIDQSTNGFD